MIEEKGKRKIIIPPDGGIRITGLLLLTMQNLLMFKGWGWYVVAASFFISVATDGIAYTFGLFFVEIEKDLHGSKSDTSWIASILAGTTLLIGPFTGAIVNRFGCRAVSAAGSVIAAFGFSISYFAQSLLFLYISIGLIGGVGIGFIYLPSIVSVTCYFEKRRSFATGIAVCGTGFGTFLLAPLFEWMIRTIGWRKSLLVAGGIILTCLFLSLLYRPLEFEEVPILTSKTTTSRTAISPNPRNIFEPHPPPLLQDKVMTVGNGDNYSHVAIHTGNALALAMTTAPISNEATGRTISVSHPDLRLERIGLPRIDEKRHSLKNFGSSHHLTVKSFHTSAHGLILRRRDIFYSGSMRTIVDGEGCLEKVAVDSSISDRNSAESTEFAKVFKAMMDFSLLKDPIFLLFAFSNFCTSFGYNVPYIYLYDKAIGEDEQHPLNDKLTSSFLLSIVGITNTFSRAGLGYLGDKPWVNRLYLYNCALTICGIATGLCSHTDDINLLRLYSATFGITMGAYISLTSVILVDLLGLEKLTNAFGLLLLFQGIGTLIGPPVVGELFDQFGNYRNGFWLAGGVIALSGVMLFLIPLLNQTTSMVDKVIHPSNTQEGQIIIIYSPDTPTATLDKGQKKRSNDNMCGI